MSNQNLFSALRAAFPSDLDSTAVETTAADGTPLYYTWRDLDRASARIANLLASLKLPEGSRVAVQVEKSVEAMALYLATLRAGYVFLPLNTAYQSAEIEYFIGNAEPANKPEALRALLRQWKSANGGNSTPILVNGSQPLTPTRGTSSATSQPVVAGAPAQATPGAALTSAVIEQSRPAVARRQAPALARRAAER